MPRKTARIAAWVFLLLVVGFFARSYWMSRDCSRMAVCFSNLRKLGSCMNMYAQDYQGNFPAEVASIYPKYTVGLSVFLCPSKAYVSHLTEKDVLRDFTVCYEYMPGLTEESDSNSVLALDRKGNHIIGHHKGSRNAVFVSGACRLLRSDEAARQP